MKVKEIFDFINQNKNVFPVSLTKTKIKKRIKQERKDLNMNLYNSSTYNLSPEFYKPVCSIVDYELLIDSSHD